MRELVAEILLRFAKVLVAAVVGVAVYALVTGPLGAAPSPEIALLSWLSGAAAILLVESGPI
jgi:hypothetical protein